MGLWNRVGRFDAVKAADTITIKPDKHQTMHAIILLGSQSEGKLLGCCIKDLRADATKDKASVLKTLSTMPRKVVWTLLQSGIIRASEVDGGVIDMLPTLTLLSVRPPRTDKGVTHNCDRHKGGAPCNPRPKPKPKPPPSLSSPRK